LPAKKKKMTGTIIILAIEIMLCYKYIQLT
jgi:hypothetical protein